MLAVENSTVIDEMENSEMGEGLGMMVAVWNINKVLIGWFCGRISLEDYNSALILHSFHTWNVGAWRYRECEIGWKSLSGKNILSLIYYWFWFLAYLKTWLGRFIQKVLSQHCRLFSHFHQCIFSSKQRNEEFGKWKSPTNSHLKFFKLTSN